MSVLIKRMEMPKDCLKCQFCLFANGYWKCLVDGSHADFGGTCRPSLCPLVPVPKHGDLIDRDALPTGRVEWEDIVNAPTIIEADESDMGSFIRIFEEDDEEDGMDSFIRILKD